MKRYTAYCLVLGMILSLLPCFSACGRAEEITPGAGITLGGTEWGRSEWELEKTLRLTGLENGRLLRDNVLFCGERASVEYIFADGAEEKVLCGADVRFAEGADWPAVAQRLDAAWGERVKYYPSADGKRLDSDFKATEDEWYWRSAEFSDEYRWKPRVTARFDAKSAVLHIDALGVCLAVGAVTSVPYSVEAARDVRLKLGAYSNFLRGAAYWRLDEDGESAVITVFDERSAGLARELFEVYDFVTVAVETLEPAPSDITLCKDGAVSVQAENARAIGPELELNVRMRKTVGETIRFGGLRMEAYDGGWYTLMPLWEGEFALDQYITDSDFTLYLSAWAYDFPPGTYRVCVCGNGGWYAAEFEVV